MTLNVNGLGAKNLFTYGGACIGGEVVAGVPVIAMYDGTQFNVVSRHGFQKYTSSIGADVALSNGGLYFDGPSIAQGTVGTWLATGSVTLFDTAAAQFDIKLWDGTTVIATARDNLQLAGGNTCVALSGYITSPVGNLRISVKDFSNSTGLIKFNSSGNSKDSTISAIRIA